MLTGQAKFQINGQASGNARIFIITAVILLTHVSLVTTVDAQAALPDYPRWRSACKTLPSNRELRGALPEKQLLPLPLFADFESAIDSFVRNEQKGPLGDSTAWVGTPPDPHKFFDSTRGWFSSNKIPFQPFAEKLVFPNDSVLIIMGDLHGDVRSLLCVLDELNERKVLEGFRICAPQYRFLFLGDFTDRGAFGVEVLYTLFRLKEANPERVFFTRGNHEDVSIASRYGFLEELRQKYGQQADITKVLRAYDLMPVVCYVGDGVDFLQMNHGGLEPGFDPKKLLASKGSPRFQLLGDLQQKTYHTAREGWLGNQPAAVDFAEQYFLDFTPVSPTSPRTIGFMWNDFSVFQDEPGLGFGRSLIFGEEPTRQVLADASTDRIRVRGVVRAHQHAGTLNPLMARLIASDGVFKHWQDQETSVDAGQSVEAIRRNLRPDSSRVVPDGSVWTLNVSPDSVYGVGCGYDFVSVGVLKLGPEFDDWRMEFIKVDVF